MLKHRLSAPLLKYGLCRKLCEMPLMFHEMLTDQIRPSGIRTNHESRGNAANKKIRYANWASAASTGMASYSEYLNSGEWDRFIFGYSEALGSLPRARFRPRPHPPRPRKRRRAPVGTTPALLCAAIGDGCLH